MSSSPWEEARQCRRSTGNAAAPFSRRLALAAPDPSQDDTPIQEGAARIRRSSPPADATGQKAVAPGPEGRQKLAQRVSAGFRPTKETQPQRGDRTSSPVPTRSRRGFSERTKPGLSVRTAPASPGPTQRTAANPHPAGSVVSPPATQRGSPDPIDRQRRYASGVPSGEAKGSRPIVTCMGLNPLRLSDQSSLGRSVSCRGYHVVGSFRRRGINGGRGGSNFSNCWSAVNNQTS
jgi:hypothetical protein